jgi:hypothetical protein
MILLIPTDLLCIIYEYICLKDTGRVSSVSRKLHHLRSRLTQFPHIGPTSIGQRWGVCRNNTWFINSVRSWDHFTKSFVYGHYGSQACYEMTLNRCQTWKTSWDVVRLVMRLHRYAINTKAILSKILPPCYENLTTIKHERIYNICMLIVKAVYGRTFIKKGDLFRQIRKYRHFFFRLYKHSNSCRTVYSIWIQIFLISVSHRLRIPSPQGFKMVGIFCGSKHHPFWYAKNRICVLNLFLKHIELFGNCQLNPSVVRCMHRYVADHSWTTLCFTKTVNIWTLNIKHLIKSDGSNGRTRKEMGKI